MVDWCPCKLDRRILLSDESRYTRMRKVMCIVQIQNNICTHLVCCCYAKGKEKKIAIAFSFLKEEKRD